MDKRSRYDVIFGLRTNFLPWRKQIPVLCRFSWRKPSTSSSVYFVLVGCWRLVYSIVAVWKDRDALERLVFESNRARFLCKGSKGKASTPKTYLNVTMALVTRSKHIFLASSFVGVSFAKLRGGVGSGQGESQSSLGTEADAVISGTVLDKLSRCKPGVLCIGSSQKQCSAVWALWSKPFAVIRPSWATSKKSVARSCRPARGLASYTCPSMDNLSLNWWMALPGHWSTTVLGWHRWSPKPATMSGLSWWVMADPLSSAGPWAILMPIPGAGRRKGGPKWHSFFFF